VTAFHPVMKMGRFRLLMALVGAALPSATVAPMPVQAEATVRLVCNGTFPGGCPQGPHSSTTIQAAVNAANPGDWILVWPGVYHEKSNATAGVLITTPGLHLRGLDRNLVVVDGSNGDSTAPCPNDPALQDFTARNGIEVFETSGVSVENLTVCDYLSDTDGINGNQIWFNGGDGTGKIGIGAWTGSHLTATSMYYQSPTAPMAQYGIFVSNANGPGSLTFSYASNMGDADFYVGACPDCNSVLDHLHAQNGSLGYSGTNSGGHLIIQNSEWDHNKTGIAPNSLNNDDRPSPQSGLCPSGSSSCTLIQTNEVHDNNNPNVPAFGISSSSPVGAGIEISGGVFNTVTGNHVYNQGAWGIVVHDFPDSETPPPGANCTGGTQLSGGVCFFNARGNVVSNNTLSNNGFFGNPTNGDLANEASAQPKNCFFGNVDIAGRLTSAPANIQRSQVDGPPCDQFGPGDDHALFTQLVCAAGLAPCRSSNYPRSTQVQMLPLTPQLTMTNPCAGVPANRWCPYTGPHL
jgi:hypothetical protein